LVVGGMIWGGVALYHAYKNSSTNAHSRSATSSATKPTLQLQTVAGLNGLLTDMRNRFGDTMGYELIVYPDMALFKRADPSNNRHVKTYNYDGGKWSDWDTSSISSDAAVVDLSKFDVAAVTAKVPGAPQSLGMTDFKQISLNVQGLTDGSLKLYVWLSDGVDIATMDLNPDGSVIALHPPH
jgi:serine/threonine-protein kinase